MAFQRSPSPSPPPSELSRRQTLPEDRKLKQCPEDRGCGQRKPLDQFRTRRDGYQMPQCSDCERQYDTDRKAKKVNLARRYNAKHPDGPWMCTVCGHIHPKDQYVPRNSTTSRSELCEACRERRRESTSKYHRKRKALARGVAAQASSQPNPDASTSPSQPESSTSPPQKTPPSSRSTLSPTADSFTPAGTDDMGRKSPLPYSSEDNHGRKCKVCGQRLTNWEMLDDEFPNLCTKHKKKSEAPGGPVYDEDGNDKMPEIKKDDPTGEEEAPTGGSSTI